MEEKQGREDKFKASSGYKMTAYLENSKIHTTHTHTYMHIYIHICTYIHTHTNIYIHMHTYTYIYTHTYTYIQASETRKSTTFSTK